MGGADVAGSNFLPCMLVLPEDNHMVHCILTRPIFTSSNFNPALTEKSCWPARPNLLRNLSCGREATRPFLAGSFVYIVVKGELIRNGKIYDECGW